MPVYTRRLLDRANVSEGDALSLDEALDLGEHHTLAIAVNVLSAGAGTAPTLTVVHAAANEKDAYTTLSEPVAVPLDATGITVVYIPAFLRWVRWAVSGTLTDGAVVTLDLIAKS